MGLLLDVKGLKTYFPMGKKGLLFTKPKYYLRAVDGVSFSIEEGETFGVAGEVGSGKTTLARTIIGLYKPHEGEVYFEGKNLFKLSREEQRKTKGKIQLIFSNPYTSLNPRMTLGSMLKEVLQWYKIGSDESERMEITLETLTDVGLEPHHLVRYPHEFSGGQRQRLAIARALIMRPKLLICDEPTIALDESVKAAVLNLLKELQKTMKEKFGMSYLFISNDLGELRYMSKKQTAMMHMGKIVEICPTKDLIESPQHPYTEHLLRVLPLPDPKIKMRPPLLKAEKPLVPPPGCLLHPRCPYAKSKCSIEEPQLLERLEKGHYVACHFPL